MFIIPEKFKNGKIAPRHGSSGLHFKVEKV
jgi:hypothetical protein